MKNWYLLLCSTFFYYSFAWAHSTEQVSFQGGLQIKTCQVEGDSPSSNCEILFDHKELLEIELKKGLGADTSASYQFGQSSKIYTVRELGNQVLFIINYSVRKEIDSQGQPTYFLVAQLMVADNETHKTSDVPTLTLELGHGFHIRKGTLSGPTVLKKGVLYFPVLNFASKDL